MSGEGMTATGEGVRQGSVQYLALEGREAARVVVVRRDALRGEEVDGHVEGPHHALDLLLAHLVQVRGVRVDALRREGARAAARQRPPR